MNHPSIVEGRTAVITGAASGIGLAAARALSAHGMAIAMIDLPGPKLAAAAAGFPAHELFPWTSQTKQP
jgi:NAD(P)-dependent dehydrogenase (short-subunit alcohol dehydrogenase family)